MADFVRRLVSGDKARFKDGELDLELDLAYITDQVIVMGYPASGLEGLYRNRREDAKKFLDHYHRKNYWVFNFCPIRENSYPSEVFEGRVSRYPFPDHLAPPLAVLPLVAREMRAWLEASMKRVAVLHCKAGKGRSGTMACAYLLTLASPPQPPSFGRSRIVREQAEERAEALMNEMPPDETVNADLQSEQSFADDPIKHELSTNPPSPAESQTGTKGKALGPANANSLDHVLKLHTQRRMKRPSSPSSKVKQGGPPGFWGLNGTECAPPPKVRLTQIKLRMREVPGLKSSLVKAASVLINQVGKDKAMQVEATRSGKDQVWASLARYDDDLVQTLEKWERETRSPDGNMGKWKEGSEHMGRREDAFKDLEKMVRVFARLGPTSGKDVQQKEEKEGENIITYALRPLTADKWRTVRQKIGEGGVKAAMAHERVVDSEEASINDTIRTFHTPEGIILDASREVRVKLYMGSVFMGWLWFIPSFHMGDWSSSASTLRLTRKEIDFPLGVGAYIVDLEVSMERCAEDASVVSSPTRQGSEDSRGGNGGPGSATAALDARPVDEVR